LKFPGRPAAGTGNNKPFTFTIDQIGSSKRSACGDGPRTWRGGLPVVFADRCIGA
jgi:hypothetical protein